MNLLKDIISDNHNLYLEDVGKHLNIKTTGDEFCRIFKDSYFSVCSTEGIQAISLILSAWALKLNQDYGFAFIK
jgi:hypothetical protein